MQTNHPPTPGSSHNGVPWRCHEVLRIEALSDAVFAFAVTLLVISLEVPKTFTELWENMRGFVAFAISFAVLFQVWYAQHSFFRRFGLHDVLTVTLNGALLFTVLFYVYPLKFLFSFLVNIFTGGEGTVMVHGHAEHMVATTEDARRMMVIYGAGFIAVYVVLAALYGHALRLRRAMELSILEVYDAQESLASHLLMALIGTASILMAVLSPDPGRAGMLFILIAPAQTVLHWFYGNRRRRFVRSMATASS